MAIIFRRASSILRTHLCSAAAFSSTSQTAGNTSGDNFRTPKAHPIDHSINDAGLFYTLPSDVALETIFKHGGWPDSYVEQCKTLKEAALMIRKPGLEIIHYIKNANYSRPINKYVIYGKPGNGKSLVLSYVLHYGFITGWLIVHLPWVPLWLRLPREVTVSKTRKGFMDMNEDAGRWLLHFRTQNFNLLKDPKLITQNDYEWSSRDSVKSGESLLHLVDFGMSRAKLASEVVDALLKEIQLLSKQGVVKTMLLIDGFNAFFHSAIGRIKDEEKNLVPYEKVTLLKAFLDIAKGDWHNGAAIFVSDAMAVKGHNESDLPFYQLTLKGFEFLVPFVPIEVPCYTREEAKNQLKYYRDRHWLQDDEGDEEILTLSCYNGYQLQKVCAPL